MRTVIFFLALALSVFLHFPAFSQSDEEYSKNTQALLKQYGGFSDTGRKPPWEYLSNDKRLLYIFEKAETFDSRFFKDDYRQLYEKYKELVSEEEILVARYYYWLRRYDKVMPGFGSSPWQRFCANVLKRGNYKRKKGVAIANELNEFYAKKMAPVLDSALVSFGQFWFKEKCRCTQQGVIWEEIVHY